LFVFGKFHKGLRFGLRKSIQSRYPPKRKRKPPRTPTIRRPPWPRNHHAMAAPATIMMMYMAKTRIRRIETWYADRIADGYTRAPDRC